MPVFLLPDAGGIAIVTFDVTMSENHSLTSEVTDHPVEKGVNVADHVRVLPTEFSCEVFVTNTPDNDLGGRGAIGDTEIIIPSFNPPPEGLGALESAAIGKIKDAIAGPKPPLKIQSLLFPTPFNRVEEVNTVLVTLQKASQTMVIITTNARYENMVISKEVMPITEAGGATFSLEFKQLTVVESSTVTAPKPAKPSGAPSQNKGAQATKPIGGKDAGKATTFLLEGLKALGLTS